MAYESVDNTAVDDGGDNDDQTVYQTAKVKTNTMMKPLQVFVVVPVPVPSTFVKHHSNLA